MPDLKRSRLYKGLGQMKVIVRMDDVKQDGILPQKLNAIDENLFQESKYSFPQFLVFKGTFGFREFEGQGKEKRKEK